jgi:hypothetical protein
VLVKDGSCSNDVFWMTTERMEWHNQPTRGDKPCPRRVSRTSASAGCALGLAQPSTYCSLFPLPLLLSPLTIRSGPPRPIPPTQPPRHGHVTVYDPEHHQLLVFGGRTAARKRLDDV